MPGSIFKKEEKHKELAKEIEADFKKLTKEGQEVLKQSIVIETELDNIKGDGKTYGLKFESDWLIKNSESYIADKINKIKSREFKSQADVDQANSDITEIIGEFVDHYENYQNLVC